MSSITGDPVVRPDRQRFDELAKSYNAIPVVQELTSDTVTPFNVYSRLATIVNTCARRRTMTLQ